MCMCVCVRVCLCAVSRVGVGQGSWCTGASDLTRGAPRPARRASNALTTGLAHVVARGCLEPRLVAPSCSRWLVGVSPILQYLWSPSLDLPSGYRHNSRSGLAFPQGRRLPAGSL